MYHVPVMLEEAVNYLNVQKGKKYIDCTLGDGGHSLEILRRGGKVLGVDVNETSIERAAERIEKEGFSESFEYVRGNFRNLENLTKGTAFEQVDGILYDLGYSSTQLEDEIGLSFLKDETLDMRLDKNLGVSAADLVNALSESELARLFRENSDEKYAKRFAKKIVEVRKLKKLQTTKQLSDLIVATAPPGYEHGRIHPATRVFQALRIAVNDEFENLRQSLPVAARLLLPGGRMVVIAFHSLEEKLVKEFGRCVRPMLSQVLVEAKSPSEEEVENNIRSRSARLLVFEKN